MTREKKKWFLSDYSEAKSTWIHNEFLGSESQLSVLERGAHEADEGGRDCSAKRLQGAGWRMENEGSQDVNEGNTGLLDPQWYHLAWIILLFCLG